MPTHKRDVLIHLQYMQSVTGGHLTTVEGWSRSHGLPYDHVKACDVYTDGSAVFLLSGVCFTDYELDQQLVGHDFAYMLPPGEYEQYALDTVRQELRKKYDAHLRQKDEQKKKTTVKITACSDGTHDVAIESTGYIFDWPQSQAVAGPRTKRDDKADATEYAVSAASLWHPDIGCAAEQIPVTEECETLAQAVAHLLAPSKKAKPNFSLTFTDKDKYEKAVSRVGECLNVLKHGRTKALEPGGVSFATRNGKLYIFHRPNQREAKHFTLPYDSPFNMNCRTHRESSRKQGKTLQQEHAARVAHSDFEAEQQSKAASIMGEMEIDPKFCQRLLQGMNYLAAHKKANSWYLVCRSQREYDFAVHSIAQWVTRCGKEGVTTIASKSRVYIKVGESILTLFLSWKQ